MRPSFKTILSQSFNIQDKRVQKDSPHKIVEFFKNDILIGNYRAGYVTKTIYIDLYRSFYE